MKPMPSWHVRRLIDVSRFIDALLGAAPVVEPEPSRAPDELGVVRAKMVGCGRCGRTAPEPTVTAHGCPVCFQRRLVWHGFTRLGEYHGPIVGQVHRLKYMGRWPLADRLGRRLARRLKREAFIDDKPTTKTVVTWVPMHWKRAIFRGSNHAQVLAWRVATELDLHYMPLVERVRDTPTQVGLSRVQRRRNLRDAFAALPVDMTGWRVILIDDVMTTGATLSACCAVLKQQGVKRVHVAVIAVAEQVD